jgi:hypothetical protein
VDEDADEQRHERRQCHPLHRPARYAYGFDVAPHLRVVVVDDSADMRGLVRARLEIAGGFEVVGEAGTGREGIDVAGRAQPDLVLLDLSMPDVDGFDAIGAIRAAAPGALVAILTGFADVGLTERALATGAAAVIEKSSPASGLAARLHAVVAGQAFEPAPEPVEEALAAHTERFRTVFEQAAIGMATLTLTGRILRANTALCAVAGSEDPTALRFSALVDDESRTAVGRAVEELVHGSTDAVMLEHGIHGRSACVFSTLTVVRDSVGRPLYLFLQAEDITTRRTTEQELRDSNQRFRALVESVADYAIFLLDPSGVITSWNRGAERIKGYRAEEIIGRHFSVFYTEEARARGHPVEELAVAARDGRYEEEGWRVRKDGSMFWASVVITAVRDEQGELRAYAKVTRDITERRRMVEALERQAIELQRANEALETVARDRTEFLAVTAHELRTPVTVVNGFASTLRDRWDRLSDEERFEMINALSRGGERLALLVRELLTASRLEAGVVEVDASDFDLAVAIAEAVRDANASSDAVVSADVEATFVHADRNRVLQMLSNYVTNALRYGGPPVVVTTTRTADGVVVRVNDSGSGVPPELVPRLFDKFTRGNPQQGTGLGLFIVRELARAQGGDAWYEARAGGGSCFALRLPSASKE